MGAPSKLLEPWSLTLLAAFPGGMASLLTPELVAVAVADTFSCVGVDALGELLAPKLSPERDDRLLEEEGRRLSLELLLP